MGKITGKGHRGRSISVSGKSFNAAEMQRQGKALSEAFEAESAIIQTALERGILASAIFVEGEAKQLSPKDTGLLRTSISHNLQVEGSIVSGYVGTNTEYGVFQELGTSRMSAANDGKGFLRPAAYENKNNILKIVKRELKKEL